VNGVTNGAMNEGVVDGSFEWMELCMEIGME